nr:ABC transporter substrate-binding protein [Dehalococcoidia bacterium]
IGAVKIIKKNKATLDVGFQSGGEQYQIIFKLRKNKKKKWLVWGLVIEGVSVIKTFQTQFSGVLKKDSLDVLLEKLRNSAPKS